METIEVKTSIYKFKIKEHKAIKKEILESIKSVGIYSFINKEQSISNTDWHLSEAHPRPYAEHCIPVLEKYYSTLNLKLNNFWFQQYGHGDYHQTHTHERVNYSSIYYLDLPKNTSTVFNDISIEVEEGDYIIFPAFFKHSSPPNKSNSIKTSIVLNLDTIN